MMGKLERAAQWVVREFREAIEPGGLAKDLVRMAALGFVKWGAVQAWHLLASTWGQ